MSKNHPHDNIYSILGKLEALKPTPEEKRFALVKEIRESVEAKGSVLEGVDAVEAKLSRQFAESSFSKMSAAIQKTGKSKASADAISASVGREKLGQKEMTRRSVAGRKDEDTCNECGMFESKCSCENTNEDMSRAAKGYEKYGKKGMLALAKAGRDGAGEKELDKIRDQHDHYNESADECCCKELGQKECPVHCDDEPRASVKEGESADECCCKELGQKECPVHCDDEPRAGVKEGETTRKYGVCVVGHNGGKPVKTFDTEAEAKAYANKGIRVDGKLLQGSVRTIVGEAETTHTGGEKVSTNKGTIHKSKATVDTEKLLSRGDVTDPDADDAPVASTEKKGRGRPKMATKDRSQASMPWGGNPPKDTYKHQKGSFVHKIAESRIMDESGETLDHVLNRFKFEVKQFEQGGELDQDLYEALFDYYCDSGEMPYGTAKARTGDPYEWVAQNLESHLQGGGIVGGNQEEDPMLTREAGIPGNVPAEQIPGKDDLLKGKGRSYYEEEVAMEDELNELAKLAGLGEVSRGEYIKQQDTAAEKSGKDKFQAFGQEFDTDEISEDDIEEGPEIFKLKADAAKKAGEKEFKGPDGKIYPVKESTTFDGHGAEESNFSVNTSMSSDGNKNVTVTATGEHAADLLQMLRIAGLGGSAKAHELEQEPTVMVIDAPEEMSEEGVEVDEPAVEPVNAPRPEYKTMRQSTMNPGEGDPGEKAMHPDRPTFKNGDNALARPATEDVLTLEARLAAEYESIKKTSK